MPRPTLLTGFPLHLGENSESLLQPYLLFPTYFLPPLRPSNFILNHTGLGSVSPTEPWLHVTKCHLLKEAPLTAPLNVAYHPLIFKHYYGTFFEWSQRVCVWSDSMYSLITCLPILPVHSVSLRHSSVLGTRAESTGCCLWLLQPCSCLELLSVLECGDEAESVGEFRYCDTIW